MPDYVTNPLDPASRSLRESDSSRHKIVHDLFDESLGSTRLPSIVPISGDIRELAQSSVTSAIAVHLDLDGWEPDLPDPASFVAYQKSRHPDAPSGGEPTTNDLWGATLFALRCALPTNALGRQVASYLDTSLLPPKGEGRAVLREGIRQLTRSGPVVVTITSTTLIPDLLFAELHQIAVETPELVLAANPSSDLYRRGWTGRFANIPPVAYLSPESADPYFAASDATLGNWREIFAARIPEGGQRLRSFLALAALGGEIVPVSLILEHMGFEAGLSDEFLDLLDEHLAPNNRGVFVDHQYSHPSFPDQVIYRFRDPLGHIRMAEALAPTASDRQIEYLTLIRERLQPASRGSNQLIASVAAASGDTATHDHFVDELAWWVGANDSETLRDYLVKSMAEGQLDPERLWRTLGTTSSWPAYRRYPLVEAYAQQPGGLPAERYASFRLTEAYVLRGLGEVERALTKATCFRDGLTPDLPLTDRAAAELLLGRLFRDKENLEAAREHLDQALRFVSSNEGSHTPETIEQLLTILHELAEVDIQKGDFVSAREGLTRAIALGEESSQPNPRHLVDLYRLQADVFLVTGEPAAARSILERVLELEQSPKGSDKAMIVGVLKRLVDILEALGDLAAARHHLEHAFNLEKSAFGNESEQISISRRRLVGLCIRLGEVTTAEALLKEGVDASRIQSGPASEEISTLLRFLADLAGHRGDLEARERFLNQAVRADEIRLGREHPNILVGLKTLADLAWQRGDIRLSIQRRQRAFIIEERLHGRDSPSLLGNLSHLAAQLNAVGDLEAARELHERISKLSTSLPVART